MRAWPRSLTHFTFSLDAGGIDQQVQGTRSAMVRDGDVQCLLTAAQGAEVCNFPVQLGQSKEAFDEPSRFSEGACHDISGSNQIDSEPRCFSAVLYEGQFLVLYFVGDQLLMHRCYPTGLKH